MTAKFSRQFWHESSPVIVLFHPDYTVGPGIKPGLLTLSQVKEKAARGLMAFGQTPPVGNYTPP